MPTETETDISVSDTRLLAFLQRLIESKHVYKFSYGRTEFDMEAKHSEAKHELSVTLKMCGQDRLYLVVFFPDVALVHGTKRNIPTTAPGLLYDDSERQWVMLPFEAGADPSRVINTWLLHKLGEKTVAEILTGVC